MNMEAILQVEHLTKRYPGFALEDVSFSLPKGTVLGLIGENGAGKSTTLCALLGLIGRESGEVRFEGQALDGNKRLKEGIGVVLDGVNFYETLTPAQVGRICRAAYRSWQEETYRQYLHRFALTPNKEIKALSKGMRVKLQIAAALSHAPRLLILDEATSGLDPVMRDEILEVFWDFVQDEEHSILLSSHISTDLERIADNILFLHKGRVRFCKPKDELLEKYGVLRCGEADFARMDKADVLAWRREDYQWSVLVPDREAARRKYRPAVLDPATLDDILLLYVKGDQDR